MADRPWLTPSMRALQQLPHIAHRSVRAKQHGDHWEATVKAGLADDPPIVWGGQGETREEAIEQAASHALGYWQQWGGTR